MKTKIGRKKRYAVSLSDGVVAKLTELGVQLAGTTSLSEAIEHSVAFAHVEMFGRPNAPKANVPIVREQKKVAVVRKTQVVDEWADDVETPSHHDSETPVPEVSSVAEITEGTESEVGW